MAESCPHLSEKGVCSQRGEPAVAPDLRTKCERAPRLCIDYQGARADAAEKELAEAQREIQNLNYALRAAEEECAELRKQRGGENRD